MLEMQATISGGIHPLPILQSEERKQGDKMKDYDEMKDYRAEFLSMTPDEQGAIWEKCGQLQVSPALVLYIEELESRLAALEAAHAEDEKQTAEYKAPDCLTQSSK